LQIVLYQNPILKRSEYNQCVDTFSDSLYRFALHFLREVEPARDVVQDCFEKLWINRKAVEFEKAKSWLFTCANHLMLNQAKRNKIKQQHLDSLFLQTDAGPGKQIEAQHLVQLLVQDLPVIQKSILLLRDLEGYSYQEIAEQLELSESQVKVYLFRARARIKKMVKEQFVLAS
jgi:RNA polymerase sigma-70 factor (ECF subfamily)